MELLNFIIAAEEGDVTPEEYLEGMAELIATGLVWELQGSWQRAAATLIEQGIIDCSGNILQEVPA